MLLLHLPSPGSAFTEEDRGPLVPDPRTLSFSFAGGQSQPFQGLRTACPRATAQSWPSWAHLGSAGKEGAEGGKGRGHSSAAWLGASG